jgi:hypothetical protein
MVNKCGSIKAILLYYNGCSAQENQFSELQSQGRISPGESGERRSITGCVLPTPSAVLLHMNYGRAPSRGVCRPLAPDIL